MRTSLAHSTGERLLLGQSYAVPFCRISSCWLSEGTGMHVALIAGEYNGD